MGLFGLSEFWDQNKVEWLSNWLLLNKFQAFDRDLDGKIKPVVTEKFEVEYWDESNLFACLDSSDKQNAGVKIKTIEVRIEYSFETFKFSTGTFLGDIRLVFIEKKNFENRQNH